MSGSDDFSFSERNKRAKTSVNVPPPESAGPAPEYSAPPPRDPNQNYTPPPPRNSPPPPPRDYTPPPPREYLPPPNPEPAPRAKSDDDDEDGEIEMPIDPWRLVGALRRRWLWLVCAAIVCLPIGALAGYLLANYKVGVALIKRDVSAPFEAGVGGEVFKPHALQAATLISLMESSQLRQRVSAEAKPYISARALAKVSGVSQQQRNNDELLTIVIQGKDKDDLVNLVNLYAEKAVALTKEVQLEDLSRTLRAYQEKEHDTGDDITKVDKEMQAFAEQYKSFNPEAETQAHTKRMADIMDKIASNETLIDLYNQQLTNKLGILASLSPLAKKLEDLREQLRVMLAKYTDQYPPVQNLMQEIAALEAQMANPNSSTNKTPSAYNVDIQAKRDTLEKENIGLLNSYRDLQAKALSVSAEVGRYSHIKSRQDSLRNKLKMLTARRSETQYYHDNADGYYRILEKATLNDVDTKSRWTKAAMLAIGGLLFGLVAAACVVVVAEVADDRLKTAADVKRVTQLPILASLGDLDKMTPAEKENWAFRAWTALSGQLSRSANHGMVCGIISSTHGEGRSTWVSLLVDAASQRGLRVLTISTRPSPTDLEEMDRAAAEAERQFTEAVEEAMQPSTDQMPSTAVTITAQALAFPAQIVQKFNGPEALPSAHIALPGWVWNIDRRKQFQRALAHWRTIENMVLLVELPPASVAEAVLLAENLPQLIWLVDSGKPRARDTRAQLETLRHAKCRLVGAVLNHAPESVWKL